MPQQWRTFSEESLHAISGRKPNVMKDRASQTMQKTLPRGPRLIGRSLAARSSPEVVYRNYRKASAGGADSSVIGFNGSVNPSTTVAILRELDAVYGTIFDFGADDGKFLISAAVASAKKAIGVEYAENIGRKLIFDAVVHRIERNHCLGLSVEWVGNDIEQV